MKDFHENEWVPGGIFSDVFPDAGEHVGLVAHGKYRLRVPEWKNHVFEAPCEHACPAGIPSQLRYNLLRSGKAEEAFREVLDYTPFLAASAALSAPTSVCRPVPAGNWISLS